MKLNKTELPKGWEVVKLKDVFERVNRKNNINNKNVLTISAQNGFISQNDFFKKNIAGKHLERYLLLKRGEFGYNKSYSKDYPMGAIKRLERYEMGIVSTLYICFSTKNINSVFASHYFESGLLNKEIYKIAEEGARNHGLLNIALEDFFKTKLIIPSSLIEQERIAEVLSCWDKAIEENLKIIALKEKRKKGLMQSLLNPKKDWVTVRIRNLGEIVTGSTPKTNIEEYWNGNITWITPSDISSSKNIDKGSRSITELGLSKIRELPPYSLLITCIASIGKNAILTTRGASNQQINALIPNKFNNVSFLYYLISFNENLLLRYSGITATNILSKSGLEKIKISLPPLAEQEKIAEILSVADEEISLLKGKVELLKKQKKYLMQVLLSGKIRLKL